MLTLLPQLVVGGISTGMLYALIALSMTVVYRATTVVNFGHGDLVMAGAYAAFVFTAGLGLPFALALALAMAVLFLLGLFIQRALIEPILTGPHISLAMMALAAGNALRGAARLEWGNQVSAVARPYARMSFLLGNVILTMDDIVISAVVLLLLAALFVVFHLAPVGKIVQAMFQTERGAALVGINVRAFHGVMWGAGAALAAVGGALLALNLTLTPDIGAWTLVRGFAAMTLGGFGSLYGAVVGGLLLGIMEKVLGFYVSTAFIDISAYVVTIVVLLVRPQGLFGRPAARRI
ncbi:MAG: branched-chain amino acid ABC transporter permease [Alphaproteobacteria bacterium]